LVDYSSREERSRAMQKTKRRKTNLILNTLIVIVIVLICIVAYSIFFAGGNHADKDTSSHKHATKTAAAVTDKKDSSKAKSSEKKDTDKKKKKEDSKQSTVKTTNPNEPNVKEQIVDSSWKPVGTQQTNGHVYSTDSSSLDWQEKLKALSYATGIDVNNMTVWFLEKGETTDQAIGTVSEKGQDQTYRVYLTWVDGKGWKPTKIYKLIQNDKK